MAPRDEAAGTRRGGDGARRRRRAAGGTAVAKGDRVPEVQRARLILGMAEACAALGAGHVTVTDVVARAGVSRRTFYEIFDDVQECLLAAIEDALARASARVRAAYAAESRWEEAIRAGLLALLALLDEEPETARLLIVDSLAAGPEAIRLRKRVLRRIAREIDRGREAPGTRAAAPPPLTAEASVGAALSVLHTRIGCEDRTPLIALANDLMSTIVLPYQGLAAARSQMDRPAAPPPAPPGRSALEDRRLLKETGVRLTDRTIQVLIALAESPGASNRQVGIAAGMRDQGQVSKLLARLRRQGVIANAATARGGGATNSWRLTQRGRALAQLVIAGERGAP